MQTIKLTNCDEVAQVSDEDYEYLVQFKWHRMATGYPGSTLGYDRRNGVRHPPETMHRVILGRWLGGVPEGMESDHADRDKLNNTRPNLRLCTSAQNMANIGHESCQGSSKYKGVARHKKKWVAQISVDNKSKYLGLFNSEDAAAAAYNRAAREWHGEFAVLNNVPDDVQDTPNPLRFNNRGRRYRGATRVKEKWMAQLSRSGKHFYLGLYVTEEAAARAWDRKAFELYGDAAPLNFPDEIKDTS